MSRLPLTRKEIGDALHLIILQSLPFSKCEVSKR